MDTQSFEAGATYPGRPTGAPGRIVLTRDYLRFHGEDDEATVILPLEGLCIMPGRNRKEVAQFSHPARGGYTVFCKDRGLFKHPALRNRADTACQLAYLNQSGRSVWLAIIGVILVAAAVAAGIALSEDRVVAAVARKIPPEMETQLGQGAIEELTATKALIEDKRLLKDLEEIARPLIEVVEDPRHPFTLHIWNNPLINASALPSGDVVVYAGLLLTAESTEEVAGVLAHEFAHVTNQHTTRQALSNLGLVNIFQALMGDLSGVSTMTGGVSLLTLQSSQDFEREADAEAFDLLVKAKINPQGLLTFFSRLRENSSPELEEMLAVLSTHPPTAERELMLQQRIDRLDLKTEFTEYKLNFKRFQNRLSKEADEKGWLEGTQ